MNKVIVELSWDINRCGSEFDLDISAFLCNEHGIVKEKEDFVFYNNLSNNSKSVIYIGDNRTGEGNKEQIKIDFSRMPENIKRIAITVTIFNAKERSQNFGKISNAYVRFIDETTDNELLKYDLSEGFSSETAIVICEIYNYNGDWNFKDVGCGHEGGLSALCRSFGLLVG